MISLLFTLSLFFSFFFSGIEIAYLSADRLYIELQKKQGTLWGKIMSFFVKKQFMFISTTLIGNTLALVVFGMTMSYVIDPLLIAELPSYLNDRVTRLLIQTIMSTMVILVVAEFLPKSLFLVNPTLMLATLAVPFKIIYYILWPLTYSVVNLSQVVITYVFRIRQVESKPIFELTDMRAYLKNTGKIKHEDEEIEINKRLFQKGLEFRQTRVRDCMTPRTEIISIENTEQIDKLKDLFVESGHTKVVVYEESRDNIVGYCHSSSLFKNPKHIQDIMTPVTVIPETMMAKSIFVQLVREHKSMAIVVDEYGGTSGMVTLEDIMEEIFGEIEDEHDEQELITKKIDDQNYLFSARHEIDYLNEHFHLNIPQGDYETLGGLVLTFTEGLPEENQVIDIPPYRFIVVKMSGNKIDLLNLIVLSPEKKDQNP